jgi:hypothetical protein
MSVEILILIGAPLGIAVLSFLLGRYAIPAILYALWAAIVMFGGFLMYSASQATGDHAGFGQGLLFVFVVVPAFVVSLIAGLIGISRARRAATP